MIYPSFSTLAVAVFLSFHFVFAIPLGTRIGSEGSPENRKLIQDTMPTVNQRIKNMQAVANLPEAQAKVHPAVVKAFGTNANIAEIKKTVDTLETAQITIPHTDAVRDLTQGGTGEKSKHVTFGQPFYSSDTNTRAGTIIHESTHATSGTVDSFDRYGRPYEKMDDIPKDKVAAGVQVGYQGSGLDELKAKHSDQMHRNADSYRVFSEECPNVRRSLYRRAMAEPHPIARYELLRRAGTACAWKSNNAKPSSNNQSSKSQNSESARKGLANNALASSKSKQNTNSKNIKVPNSKSNIGTTIGNNPIERKTGSNRRANKGGKATSMGPASAKAQRPNSKTRVAKKTTQQLPILAE